MNKWLKLLETLGNVYLSFKESAREKAKKKWQAVITRADIVLLKLKLRKKSDTDKQ